MVAVMIKQRPLLLRGVDFRDHATHRASLRPSRQWRGQRITARVDFSVDDGAEPLPAVCLVPLSMNVGSKYYLAIIAVPGEATPLHDGRFSIPTTHYPIVYQTVLDEQERTEKIDFRAFAAGL